jgi:hypothetical protein
LDQKQSKERFWKVAGSPDGGGPGGRVTVWMGDRGLGIGGAGLVLEELAWHRLYAPMFDHGNMAQ